MQSREVNLVGFSLAVFIGALLLFGLVTWYLWSKSVNIEEARVAVQAEVLGQRTEQIIVNSRNMLDDFNKISAPPCSAAHINTMHEAAVGPGDD